MIAIVSLFCTAASITLGGSVLYDQLELHGDPRVAVLGLSACSFAALSCLLGIYARMVVSRIVLLPGGHAVQVTSLALSGTREREVPLSAMSVGHAHPGDRAGEETFSGPWIKIMLGDARMLLPLSGPRDEMERLVLLLQLLCARSVGSVAGAKRPYDA